MTRPPAAANAHVTPRSALRAPWAAAALVLASALGPALLDRLGLDGIEPRASAQTDAVTEVARAKYREGVKAYEAGKYDDARAAFLQAYALKRVPAVLLNLGQSELRTAPPHYEDAGNHFLQFLREHKAATPDERSSAEKGVVEVRKHSAWVVISCDTMGAEVSVDGTAVGQSPLSDSVFVRPGKHVIAATFNGQNVNDAVDAKLSAPTDVALRFGAGAPPVVAPVPVPVPTPGPPLPPAVEPPPVAEPPPTPPPTPEPTPNGQSLGQWFAHKPFAWVTAGTAGVGLLGGVIFSAAAGAAASKTNDAAGAIRQHLPPSGGAPCAADGSGAPDATINNVDFTQACTTLRDDESAYHTDVALAVTGWVLLGVGAGATVTYALVDWYPHRNEAPASGAASPFGITGLTVVPVVAPGFQGASVGGKF